MTFDTSWCFTPTAYPRTNPGRQREFFEPYDALTDATGATLRRMRVSPAGDSALLDSRDATEMLCAFARFCALSVADLWDAPDIVREWLETGVASLRTAAFIERVERGGRASQFAQGAASWAMWGAGGDIRNTIAWKAAQEAGINARLAATRADEEADRYRATIRRTGRDRFNAMAAELFEGTEFPAASQGETS